MITKPGESQDRQLQTQEMQLSSSSAKDTGSKSKKS